MTDSITLTETYALPFLKPSAHGGRAFAAVGTLEEVQAYPSQEICGRPMRCTAGAIREVRKNMEHGYSKRGCVGPHWCVFEDGSDAWVTRSEYYLAKRLGL